MFETFKFESGTSEPKTVPPRRKNTPQMSLTHNHTGLPLENNIKKK